MLRRCGMTIVTLLAMARVIPVTIHLYQADLLNLEPVRAQINHDFVTNFAEEITEVVGVRIINQAQDAIQRGDVIRWLFRPDPRRPYVNINNINEKRSFITPKCTSSFT